MARTESISWTRVVVEGVVIVGSILIAFGIDALWETRQANELTQQHLEALVAEFRSVRDEVRSEASGVASSAEGSAGVLAMMRAEEIGTAEQFTEYRRMSFDVGLFTARHPVLTTMLTSGELIDLQNDSLMTLVGRWQDEVEHLRADSEHLERNREETIIDRVIAIGVPYDVASPRFSLSRLLSDGGLEAAFSMREGRAVRLQLAYDRVADLADDIIALVEEESVRMGR